MFWGYLGRYLGGIWKVFGGKKNQKNKKKASDFVMLFSLFFLNKWFFSCVLLFFATSPYLPGGIWDVLEVLGKVFGRIWGVFSEVKQ